MHLSRLHVLVAWLRSDGSYMALEAVLAQCAGEMKAACLCCIGKAGGAASAFLQGTKVEATALLWQELFQPQGAHALHTEGGAVTGRAAIFYHGVGCKAEVFPAQQPSCIMILSGSCCSQDICPKADDRLGVQKPLCMLSPPPLLHSPLCLLQ